MFSATIIILLLSGYVVISTWLLRRIVDHLDAIIIQLGQVISDLETEEGDAKRSI